MREYGQKGLDGKKIDCPVSIAFTRSGNVTICNSAEIFCFTERGWFIKNISKEHVIKPNFITIACDSRMLVCDCGDRKVKVLSPDGAELMQSFSSPGFTRSPWFALHHQDRFFVSYAFAHYVEVFNNEGEFLYDIGREGTGKLNDPAGLAVDKFNNLLVCDRGNCKVSALEGKFLNLIKTQPAQLQRPFSVAVSNAGQVFITEMGEHCVHVFE